MSSFRWIAASLLLLIQSVAATCECGYSVNATSSQHQVFTDLIESDFLTIQDIKRDTDWEIQRYWVGYDPNNGYYGENFTAQNVVSNPLKDNYTLAGPSQLGGDAGLQLWVSGGTPSDGLVLNGEVKTARDDIKYGSFRVGMKLTPINGTCSAFFSYYNDTQEIDMELLSHQYMNYTRADPNGTPKSPINLVFHSLQTILAGYQTPNTSTYGVPVLPISLSDAFHEYRFDWTPERVSFYFDGQWLWDLIDEVPSLPSAILLRHWSNGARGWTKGPPITDAVMTVSYFKAYFNSSDTQRVKHYSTRCKDPEASGAVCLIPDQTVAPDPKITTGVSTAVAAANGSANTFFFSQQTNQTFNQTVYTGVNGGMVSVVDLQSWTVCTVMLVICGIWLHI
ncbi:glycoside hydrolase family 16 protein [Penicillium taxi]|uniref:glycoside hydrolase family 16 protein n=1 Tax=Penicillium taxi TaxID=168475 RepID=UPI0025455919|nr:glycoside hydrolase family 16 protein [Penicillium taxi]KAJ5893742.1 glycoside hydrolase family 16 protein [Penicillium taxi]